MESEISFACGFRTPDFCAAATFAFYSNPNHCKFVLLSTLIFLRRSLQEVQSPDTSRMLHVSRSLTFERLFSVTSMCVMQSGTVVCVGNGGRLSSEEKVPIVQWLIPTMKDSVVVYAQFQGRIFSPLPPKTPITVAEHNNKCLIICSDGLFIQFFPEGVDQNVPGNFIFCTKASQALYSAAIASRPQAPSQGIVWVVDSSNSVYGYRLDLLLKAITPDFQFHEQPALWKITFSPTSTRLLHVAECTAGIAVQSELSTFVIMKVVGDPPETPLECVDVSTIDADAKKHVFVALSLERVDGERTAERKSVLTSVANMQNIEGDPFVVVTNSVELENWPMKFRLPKALSCSIEFGCGSTPKRIHIAVADDGAVGWSLTRAVIRVPDTTPFQSHTSQQLSVSNCVAATASCFVPKSPPLLQMKWLDAPTQRPGTLLAAVQQPVLSDPVQFVIWN